MKPFFHAVTHDRILICQQRREIAYMSTIVIHKIVSFFTNFFLNSEQGKRDSASEMSIYKSISLQQANRLSSYMSFHTKRIDEFKITAKSKRSIRRTQTAKAMKNESNEAVGSEMSPDFTHRRGNDEIGIRLIGSSQLAKDRWIKLVKNYEINDRKMKRT